MKSRTALIIIAVLVLGSLTFAQNQCPEQEYKSWSGLPVQIDPNMIAVHPISGQPLYLGAVTVELGKPWQYLGYGCDEDGDALMITADYGTLVAEPNSVYTLTATETSIGVKYRNVTATDAPAPPAAPISVTGTLVVIVTPRNHEPVLCGGRPN